MLTLSGYTTFVKTVASIGKYFAIFYLGFGVLDKLVEGLPHLIQFCDTFMFYFNLKITEEIKSTELLKSQLIETFFYVWRDMTGFNAGIFALILARSTQTKKIKILGNEVDTGFTAYHYVMYLIYCLWCDWNKSEDATLWILIGQNVKTPLCTGFLMLLISFMIGSQVRVVESLISVRKKEKLKNRQNVSLC